MFKELLYIRVDIVFLKIYNHYLGILTVFIHIVFSIKNNLVVEVGL